MKTEAKNRPMTRREVELERIRNVSELAAKSFEKHQLQPQWFGVPCAGGLIEAQAWRCGRPGDCVYAFTIYSVPGRLIVCGDIGTLVVERTRNMLAWARSAIDGIDYFAGKVVSEIETEEYDADMARAWVHETDQDILEGEHSDEFANKWRGELRRELLGAIEEGEHQARRVWWESSLSDGDPPSWVNWKHGFLWQREAIKWFLAQGTDS